MFMESYCQDVSSSQLDLQIQSNPNQNPCELFCRRWQTDSKVYMERQKIQNSQTTLKEKKKARRLTRPNSNTYYRKTNTIWFHLYMESKKQNKWTNKTKQNPWIQRKDWWLPEGKGVGNGWNGEMGEGDQEVQTSSHKINKSWGCNIQHGGYNWNWAGYCRAFPGTDPLYPSASSM